MLKKAITLGQEVEQICEKCKKLAAVLVPSNPDRKLICLECKKEEDENA